MKGAQFNVGRSQPLSAPKVSEVVHLDDRGAGAKWLLESVRAKMRFL